MMDPRIPAGDSESPLRRLNIGPTFVRLDRSEVSNYILKHPPRPRPQPQPSVHQGVSGSSGQGIDHSGVHNRQRKFRPVMTKGHAYLRNLRVQLREKGEWPVQESDEEESTSSDESDIFIPIGIKRRPRPSRKLPTSLSGVNKSNNIAAQAHSVASTSDKAGMEDEVASRSPFRIRRVGPNVQDSNTMESVRARLSSNRVPPPPVYTWNQNLNVTHCGTRQVTDPAVVNWVQEEMLRRAETVEVGTHVELQMQVNSSLEIHSPGSAALLVMAVNTPVPRGSIAMGDRSTLMSRTSNSPIIDNNTSTSNAHFDATAPINRVPQSNESIPLDMVTQTEAGVVVSSATQTDITPGKVYVDAASQVDGVAKVNSSTQFERVAKVDVATQVDIVETTTRSTQTDPVMASAGVQVNASPSLREYYEGRWEDSSLYRYLNLPEEEVRRRQALVYRLGSCALESARSRRS